MNDEQSPPLAELTRRPPRLWQSILVLARADLAAIWRSWLCRGFLIVSALLTILTLKGMQADQAVASHMLEVVYTTYIIIWMHAVIFIAGGALSHEQDCLMDAILSRGVTRGEYIGAKLVARSFAIMVMFVGVLLPASFWAMRQDKLVRTDSGYVAAHSWGAEVEPWDAQKLFAGAQGTVLKVTVEESDRVNAGDVLVQLDDRELFDELETRRRAEEGAVTAVEQTTRDHEESIRAVSGAESAVERARRALRGKEVMSRIEGADREADLREAERRLQNARNEVEDKKAAIASAKNALELARSWVRDARVKLGHSTITAPISGYVTEAPAEVGQYVIRGTHLVTIAPLYEYQLRVAVNKFGDFQRMEEGLKTFIKIQKTEFEGTVHRIGATTRAQGDGAKKNFVIVRFNSGGKLGLLGLGADVRIVMPPKEEESTMAGALLDTVTGRSKDDTETKTASVTTPWMLLGLSKVVGCTLLLIALSMLAAVLTRNALIAILGVTGIWHISTLIFDFVGLPELSYFEMVRTMDKVLAGVASVRDELTAIAWLFGIAGAFASLTVAVFISRDPPK